MWKSSYKATLIFIFAMTICNSANSQSKSEYKAQYQTYLNLCEYLRLEGCYSKGEKNSKSFFRSESARLEKLVKREIRRQIEIREEFMFSSREITQEKDSLIQRCRAIKNELESVKKYLDNEREEKEMAYLQIRELEDELRRSQVSLERFMSENSRSKRRSEQVTEELIKSLKKGKSNQYYEINPLPDNEIVKGKVGLYFMVEFKNPVLEKTLYFELEEYTIDKFDKQYQKSINRFYSDVIDIIESDEVSEFEFFIKGSADVDKYPKFSRPLKERYQFNEIKILKLNSVTDQYEYDEFKHYVSPQYGNEQLPNLRAEFIRNVLTREPYDFSNEKVHVLEGFVTESVNRLDRNVTILLFVKRN